MHEELDLVNPQARLHEQELVSDLPGRSFDRAGEGRHAMESRTGPKRVTQIAFAREIAHHLEQVRNSGACERLVVIAAPAFLGLLRNELSDALHKATVASLDKDLTALGSNEILDYVPREAFNLTA
jgi:protein required for attachment to host cells